MEIDPEDRELAAVIPRALATEISLEQEPALHLSLDQVRALQPQPEAIATSE
jgi:hypothetical protein